MGLLDLFSKRSQRYITSEVHGSNRARQTGMAPGTLAQLRKLGVTDERELKLEYFFYTNSPARAAALARVLSGKGYEVRHGTSASDKRLQIVTGWTAPIPMQDASVRAWVAEMCDLGFAHDSEFDGWGTTPEQ
jgi:Regulator of ribonuclease activity B